MCDEVWGVSVPNGFVSVRVGTGCFCTEGMRSCATSYGVVSVPILVLLVCG
jgi:hypothetical protein